MFGRAALLVALAIGALTACSSAQPVIADSVDAPQSAGVRSSPTSSPLGGEEPDAAKGVASCDPSAVQFASCTAFTVEHPTGQSSSFEAWFDELDGAARFVVGESEHLRAVVVRLTGTGATAAPAVGWAPLQRSCSAGSECELDQTIEHIFTAGARITRTGRDLRLAGGGQALTLKGTGRTHQYVRAVAREVHGRTLLTHRDDGMHMDAANGGRLSMNAAGCLTDGLFVLVLPDTTVLHEDGSIDIAGRHVPLGGRLHLGGGEGPVPANQRCGTGGYFYGWGA